MSAHVPTDLRYTAVHEWVRMLGDGRAQVGITHFAQEALGDIVFVTLPQPDATVAAETECGELESTKSVSDIYAPLTGQITAINSTLDASPELINTDPYGQGWIFEMQLADVTAVGQLLAADAYTALLS